MSGARRSVHDAVAHEAAKQRHQWLQERLDATRAAPSLAAYDALAVDAMTPVARPDIPSYWTDRTAALAEALHDVQGTQHYMTHEPDYDGEDMEIVQCIGGPDDHREDAKDALIYLREHGWTLEREG